MTTVDIWSVFKRVTGEKKEKDMERLRQDIEVENADPLDETLAGGLEEHSEGTPVFLNHPAVRFFIDIKKRKGQEI